MNCKVLARIPDLNTYHSDDSTEERLGTKSRALYGRILNQSLSIKLMSGLTVLLVIAALFSFGKKNGKTDTAAAVDPHSEWQSGGFSGQDDKVARTPAPRPMTLVSATPERSDVPEKIPAQGETQDEPRPHAVPEAPLMSSWPNPAHPIGPQNAVGPESPREVARHPMAVRPSEYQADARNAGASRGPVKGSGENTNDNPAARNRYESTRPSIY